MKFNSDPAFLKQRAEAYKAKKSDPNSGNSNRDFVFTKSVTLYKPHDGDNTIRLLPNPDPDAMFPCTYLWIHYNLGPNGSQYLCLAKMKNMPCPVCEEHKRVKDSDMPDKEKEQALNGLYASERATAYLVDRLEKDPAKNPQIWPMPSKKVAQNILGLSFSKKTGEALFFDDPKNGYDVFFSKTGKELSTAYNSIQRDDDTSPLSDDKALVAKWLAVVEEFPIYKILNFKSYDYIKAVLNGEDPNMEVSSKPITSAASKAKAKTQVTISNDESTDNIPVETGLSLEKLSQMDRAELVQVIEDNKLSINPDDWDEDEDLRSAVSLDLGITA